MDSLKAWAELSVRFLLYGALFLCGSLGAPPHAMAQSDSALGFVERLYQLPRLWSDASGNAAARQRYLSPDLAALIIENRASSSAFRLDYDPLVDDSERAVTDLSLTIEEASGTKTLIRAEFLNLGEPGTVTLEIDRLADGWRLGNIWFADGRSVADELEWLNGG